MTGLWDIKSPVLEPCAVFSSEMGKVFDHPLQGQKAPKCLLRVHSHWAVCTVPEHVWLPKSSLVDQCERSFPCSRAARFAGPGTVTRAELQHGTDAHPRAQARSANIAVTVCGGFTLNSGRQADGQWKNSRLSFTSQIPENNLKILLQDEKMTVKIEVTLHRSGSSSVLRGG